MATLSEIKQRISELEQSARKSLKMNCWSLDLAQKEWLRAEIYAFNHALFLLEQVDK